MSKKHGDNEGSYLQKPKAIHSSKVDRIGSKTAPIETNFNFDEFENDADNSEYISSYNYYIYYHSIRPRDPRLPKPTYKPMPDLDFIKRGRHENEIIEHEEDYSINTHAKDLGLTMKSYYHDDSAEEQPLENMINNLSINDKIRGYGGNTNSDMGGNQMNFSPGFQSNSNNSEENFYNQPPSYDGMNKQGYDYSYGMGGEMGYGNAPYMPNQPEFNPYGGYNKGNNMMGGNMPNNMQGMAGMMTYPMGGMNPMTGQFGGPMGNQNMNIPYYGNYYYGQNFNPMQGMYMNNPNMGMNMPYKNPPNQFAKQRFPPENVPYGNYAQVPSKKVMSFDSPSFNEILANLVDLARDHSGSRLVQKKYEDGSDEEKEKIFDKIFPEIFSLTKDVFGNYVIQKLLEHSTPEKRRKIINQLEGRIYELTMHMYGCRVIQKAIEVAEEDDVRKHLNELKNYIKICIEDQNGNHVIQKLIEKLPPGEHKEILRVITGKTYELSTHQYGCRVIQRIFEFCLPQEKEKILHEIYERIVELCQDQYGNYVIQHVIEKMDKNKIDNIFRDIKGRVFELSIHKFASNVLEKCLAFGNERQIRELIEEIILKDDMTNDSLLAMVKDKYGNYVVQKMIEAADQKTKENIVKRIISSQALKKRDGFSKHVINFIEKMGFSAGVLNNQINQSNNNGNWK